MLWLLLVTSLLLTCPREGRSCCSLKWVHAPKTASTFCLTLQHLCLQEQFNNITALYDKNGTKSVVIGTRVGCVYVTVKNYPVKTCWFQAHAPIHKKTTNFSDYVGIFREPNSRLISAFFDSKHHEGMSQSAFNAGMNHTKHTNMSETFRHYIRMRGMHGCQVKMLAGYQCSADINITQQIMNRALLVVRSMKFVCLTSRYADCVVAFHYIMGNHTYPHPIETNSYRVGKTQSHIESLRSVLHEEGYRDEYDELLIVEVSRIFDEVWAKISLNNTT
jgi:hypothetical protein